MLNDFVNIVFNHLLICNFEKNINTFENIQKLESIFSQGFGLLQQRRVQQKIKWTRFSAPENHEVVLLGQFLSKRQESQ